MSEELDWDAGAAPRSRRYDDIYYHPRRGAEEAAFTFLSGCGLPEGWRRRPLYCIGETGFGTGLNLLVTLEAWCRSRRPGQRLHYVSVEAHALRREDLARAHGAFPALGAVSRSLLAVYPRRPGPGPHRLHLDAAQVTLDLLVGEASEMLGELEGRMDAWYLDGFAPSRNPQMWRPELLREVARLSDLDTRLATFTAAGAVRRGLEHVGFAVHRTAGFDRKRERIVARFDGPTLASALPSWARLPLAGSSLEVRGDGIAGHCLAASLERRGLDFHWRGDDGPRGSEVPRALVMPRFTADDSIPGRFFAAAFRYARQHYRQLGQWQETGSLMLARDSAEAERFERIAGHAGQAGPVRLLPPAEAAQASGLPLRSPALHLPETGLVAPARLLRRRPAAAPAGDLVLWAGGPGTRRSLGEALLPLAVFRGQVSLVPTGELLAGQRATVVAGHYLTPARDGTHMIGATFDPVEPDAPPGEVRAADHRRNLDLLAAALGLPRRSFRADHGWTGLRAALPDRLPAAGIAPDAPAFTEHFAGLRNGVLPAPMGEPARALALTGLGARGYTVAPLAAELVVSQLLGEPWPLPRKLALAVAPVRFLVRALKRRQL